MLEVKKSAFGAFSLMILYLWNIWASLLPQFFIKQDLPQPAKQPVQVILDTDMDSDVDDAGALAMLHSYERLGAAKILGVIVTSDEKYSAACTHAINTYFGRGDIPIGVSQRDSLKTFSRYTRQIAETFPNRFSKSDAVPEDGTVLYRRLLASAADHSVTIITIGHLTSLSRLLNAPPDSISKLSGLELVKKKVRRWSCMGGQFPKGKEANFYRPDPTSTVDVLNKWTLPVNFSGWELGNLLVTGGTRFKDQANPDSPIYKAYELYNGFKGRASWDQVAILDAVEEHRNYFEIVRDGHCSVSPDGNNLWCEPVIKTQGYLRVKTSLKTVQDRIETLMLGAEKR